jgi:hypothetical protein
MAIVEIETPRPTRNEKGIYLQGFPGNRAGRPVGSRNALGEAMLADLYHDWLGQMQTQIEGSGERIGSLAAAGTAVGSVIAFIMDPNDLLALLLGAALGAMIGVLSALFMHSPARD